MYYKVSPKTPLTKTFTYKFSQSLKPGQRVKIPFGHKKINGFILEKEEKLNPSSYKIKEIAEIDENSKPLDSSRLDWLKWMSRYYHYPLGLVLDLSFLPGTFKNKELLKPQVKKPAVFNEGSFAQLNLDQKKCFEEISKHKNFQVHLIHGVTGSGKTEVYIRLIAQSLKQGKQALLLLPEIFLTPQIVSRLSQVFPDQIALLHSQVTSANKKKEWRALLSGEKNLLVGTRSALFCPLPRLGIIIIDEEHDSSFKQEEKFRYHARDSAIVLAKKLNIPVVLSSATPDFSSYKKAMDSSYKLYELKHRALKQSLPQVSIVDLKGASTRADEYWLSDILLEKMESTLKNGKQVALFLNRRGRAGAVFCGSCGHIYKCPNCDISLTLHQQNYLICHYCFYLDQKPERCSSCGSNGLIEKGLGTQKLEEKITQLFPEYKTLRVDRDTVPSEKSALEFIKKVEKGEVQILVGTQMLSKGLNFPSMYLVGLVLADMDLHHPDFRAEERSFQTLLQMSGRAGRFGFGEVVLQTFYPEHSNFLFAKNHDYKSFYLNSIKSRKNWFYPPFSRLCLLRIDSLKEKEGKDFSKNLADIAKALALDMKGSYVKGVQVLGPSQAPIMKIKNRYRFQILIKAEQASLLDDFLDKLFLKTPKKSFVQLKVDRDPSSMF